MNVAALFGSSQDPVFSFEFFLPKSSEDIERFKKTVTELNTLNPAFVTITYGAGGSERDKTVDAAGMIQNELGLETAAHLTCITHTKAEISAILDRIQAHGISTVVALRGDAPKDTEILPADQRELPYGRDLVAHIKAQGGFSIAVAGYPETHPEASSPEEDLRHLKEKVDAGASWIITQLFFNNAHYFEFVKRARAIGITCPIIPGIMPITSYKQTKRFTQMCGAELPQRMIEQLAPIAEDKERVVAYGIDYALGQCRELLARGAPGIHFYTLNRSKSTSRILTALRKE
jgi:methylenetetrahydrofolate reductase (NADPH)